MSSAANVGQLPNRSVIKEIPYSATLTHDAGEDGAEKPGHNDEADLRPVNAAELMLHESKAENAADDGMSPRYRKFGVCGHELPDGRTWKYGKKETMTRMIFWMR